MKARLVTLDAVGTIIEVARPVADTYAAAFARHGLRVDPAAIGPAFALAFRAAAEPAWGQGADGDAAERAWWCGLVEAVARELGAPADWDAGGECFRELFEHFAEPRAWRVLEDTRPFLHGLRARGLRVVVASNFDLRLHPVLAGLGLGDAFERILTSAEVRARKPDPAILLAASKSLALPAAAVRHIGDCPRADGGAALAAGIPAFILDRPDTSLAQALDWLDAG